VGLLCQQLRLPGSPGRRSGLERSRGRPLRSHRPNWQRGRRAVPSGEELRPRPPAHPRFSRGGAKVIAIPALDLRDGCCVQLVGGRYEQERVRLKDPIQVAASWAELGFRRLHVVDLDAATGRSSNRELVRELLSLSRMEIQVGGGIRSEAQIDEWLSAGARAIVVGTKAMEEPAWLRQMAGRYPGRLVIAADVRDRQVLARGWQQVLPLDIAQAIAGLGDLALAAVLVTAVHKEGQMAGTDLELMEEV